MPLQNLHLLYKSSPQLSHSWAFLDFPNVYVINCCLNKCVHVTQALTVGSTKNKMCFKQFIKSTKRTSCLTWNCNLVHYDVERMNVPSCCTNCKKVGLAAFTDGVKMFLDAGSCLKKNKTTK